MIKKTCFFIGHREAPEEIYPALYDAVKEHIVHGGVTEFIVGQYGGFDRLAARAVKAVKQSYPEVTLTLLLAYHPSERPVFALNGFESTFYPPEMEKVPHKAAIVKANQYIVAHADYLIAYAWHSASNAMKMLEYARQRERKGLIQITEIVPVL